jgi:hypothetical protein
LYNFGLYSAIGTIDYLNKNSTKSPDYIEVYLDYMGSLEANISCYGNRAFVMKKNRGIIWAIDATKSTRQTTATKLTCNFKKKKKIDDYTNKLKCYWGDILTVNDKIVINLN